MRGLCDADRDIRSALCHLIGRPLSDDDWRLASLGITAEGLGAWSAEHAPAAYVPASLLVVTCAAFFGRISTPSTLMMGAAFLLLSPPFAASFRPGPTSMLKVILQCWKSRAFLLPPRPPDPGGPEPGLCPPPGSPSLLPVLVVVVLLMSGSPGVCPASLRLGIFRSPPCSGPPTSLRPPRRLLVSSVRLKLANVPSRARPLLWPIVRPPLFLLSWRLAGRGLVPGLAGGRELDRLRVTLAASPLTCLVTPASRVLSASAARFIGRTRAQSWDALLGRLMVARVWSATRILRLVGDHLVWVADPSSCCCVSFHLVAVSVLSPFLLDVLCLSLCVAPSLALVRFARFSALPLGSVVMCLRPSLLALRYYSFVLSIVWHRSFSDFPCFQGPSVSSLFVPREGTAHETKGGRLPWICSTINSGVCWFILLGSHAITFLATFMIETRLLVAESFVLSCPFAAWILPADLVGV